MKRKRYSLKSPVLYLVSGLLHFILMFFGYANEFAGLSVSHMRELYSVYGSIRFGDAAIGSYFCGLAEQCGQMGKFTFFATLSTVFVLVSMALAVVVTVCGVFGLVKRLAHIDMTPGMRDAAFDSRARLWAILYQISVVLSVACLLMASFMNFHKVGGKSYCVLPGLGMLLLFVAVVVEFILLCVFKKKADDGQQTAVAASETSECSACRAHVTPGMLFCPVCGVRLRQPAPEASEAEAESAEDEPEPEARPFPYKKYFGVFSQAMSELREGAERRGISQRAVSVLSTLCVIFMILSVVLQLVSTVVMIPEKTLSSPMENDISALYDEANKNNQILTQGHILQDTIPGTVYDVVYSLDGKTALMRNFTDGKYHLYLCRGTSLQKIVTQSNKGHAMSADGSTVAYINDDRQLALYHVSRGDTDIVTGWTYDDFVLSPDGGSVLYRRSGEKTSLLCAYIEGETLEISNNGFPIALSDGGKVIYYFDFDLNAVCARKQGGETVILAETEDNRSLTCYLNRDHTELLFSLADQVYYVRKGSEAVLLTQKGIKTMGDFAYWCRVSDNTLPIDSFAGQYFTDEDIKLHYIGKNGLVSVVGENVGAFSTSLSGDVAYYTTVTQDFYRIESRAPEKKIKVASGVAAYILSPDGRHCYYLDRENNFWHITDDGKPRFVAANVLLCTVSREGYGLFMIKNPETKKFMLCATRKAGQVMLICEDVAAVTATYNRCYYFVATDADGRDDTYEMYGSDGGLIFKKVTVVE